MNQNAANKRAFAGAPPAPTARQAADGFMVDLAALCDRRGVSLFFGDRFAELWAGGYRVGALSDSEGAGGDRFELLDPAPDLRSESGNELTDALRALMNRYVLANPSDHDGQEMQAATRALASLGAAVAPAPADPSGEDDLHDRAVSTLCSLLEISRGDAWGLGSDALDEALSDAREIVEEALGDELVVFSQEEFERDGTGFWSTEEGWTEFDLATVFRERKRQGFQLPMPSDACWMPYAEAQERAQMPERNSSP